MRGEKNAVFCDELVASRFRKKLKKVFLASPRRSGEYLFEPGWTPVCPSGFWDNDAGARLVCARLGLGGGTATRSMEIAFVPTKE